MNNLISEIENRVVTTYDENGFVNVCDYSDLVYNKEIDVETVDGIKKINAKIWNKAIQKALDENKKVYIPNMNEDMYIDSSIIMRDNYQLKVDQKQRIALTPNTGLCLVRNENLIAGNYCAQKFENPDSNIVIDGGIWDALHYVRQKITNGNGGLRTEKENPILGAWAIMIFSNVKDIIIHNATFTNSASYAVEISNCEGMSIQNILFENYFKDGIHVNGPVKYGILNELSGKNMGDDMVALNAWDWGTSAMSFGTIEKLIVQNIHSLHNEFRMLPGRKTYEDKSYRDCDIRDMVIRNIEGVYTFKLYGQPRFNLPSDCSEILGNIENIYFENIIFPEVTGSGFGGLPVKGLFEVCSDVKNVHFNNIQIQHTVDEFKEKDIKVIKVGPLSETFKNGPDPANWNEMFYPDDICTMKDTHIGKIQFSDKVATENERNEIITATKMTINEDYPNTTPKGGTGYGIIDNVIFE